MKDLIAYCAKIANEDPIGRAREISYLVRLGEKSCLESLKRIVENKYRGVDSKGDPVWDFITETERSVEEKAKVNRFAPKEADNAKTILLSVINYRYPVYFLPAFALAGNTYPKVMDENQKALIRKLGEIENNGFFLNKKAPKWFIPDAVLCLLDTGINEDNKALQESIKWTLGETSLANGRRYLGRKEKEQELRTDITGTSILLAAIYRVAKDNYSKEKKQMADYLIEGYQEIMKNALEEEDDIRSACRVVWALSFSNVSRQFDVGVAANELSGEFKTEWEKWIISSPPMIRLASLCECIYLLKAAKDNLSRQPGI